MTLINAPMVTVVTVCYNSVQTIEYTIKSVLSQSYRNIEYLIIDGYSTDGTINIINKYKDKLRLISEPDNGIYDAMNKSLKHASGQWLYFLGSDDIFADDTVITDFSNLIGSESEIYYGNVIFKSSNKPYSIEPDKKSLCYRNISHQSIFYPRAIYSKFYYDLKYPIFADHIYNINLLTRNYKFNHFNRNVAIYNDRGKSSFGLDEQYYDDLPGIVSKQFGLIYGLYVFIRIKIFRLKRKLI